MLWNKKYQAKEKEKDLTNSPAKTSLEMKVEYYLFPYNKRILKDDKGMNFNESDEIWGKIANFILSDKTSMFYDTLYKIRYPDVRDRMLHAVKRVMKLKSTMTQDNFSTKDEHSSKPKVKFADWVKLAVNENKQLR